MWTKLTLQPLTSQLKSSACSLAHRNTPQVPWD